MHVKLIRVTEMVISTNLTKKGFTISRKDPKDGWWKVVWVRKRGQVKDVSGILTKKKAQNIADMLNMLPKQHAVLLVATLHSQGVEAQRNYQRKYPSYTGRSFTRNE